MADWSRKILTAEFPAPLCPAGVQTLPDLLAHQARLRGPAPFLTLSDSTAGASSISYEQAASTSARWSCAIQKLLPPRQSACGTPSAGVIGIWLERSIELHLAIFASTMSGEAWLTFDQDAPVQRLAACLADCGADLLLCDEAHFDRAIEAAQILSIGLRVIKVSDLDGMSSDEDAPAYGPSPDDTAYIIYTSGSTGTPKGIAISHRSALTFALSERSILRTNENDIVWQGFSPAFDMFIEEVWVSIAGGAHLVVGSRDQCRNVASLGGREGVWDRHKITVINAVPTLVNIMTSLVTDDEGLPPSVRLLNLGGEACPPALVKRLWRPSLTILNTYGPTETTVTATYDDLVPDEPVTIGKPLPAYHALIIPINEFEGCSEGPEPLEFTSGVEGQLCIGGPCVGIGYIGRPALTSEKFVPHPFYPDQRMYKTGDRVRLDNDQRLHFIGRIDTQVKHRGFRIELSEIESVLTTNAHVQVAAVICADAGEESARLEAFVIPRENGQTEDEITRLLRLEVSRLPCYMRPETYFFLTSELMPRLPSGKINSKGLHLISAEKARSATETTFTAVQDQIANLPTLGVLLRIMSTVFPQQAKSGSLTATADFFFDLGGHSLTAAVLVSRLRKDAVGSDLESIGLADIYELRNARALAERYPSFTTASSVKEDLFKDSLSYNSVETDDQYPGIPAWKFALCGFFQLLAVLSFSVINAIALLGPYLIFATVYGDAGIGYAILATYGSFVVLPPVCTVIGILGKWISLGRAKAGKYPLYGLYYYRWWLASRFVDLVDQKSFSDCGLYPPLLRLLGARIGAHCHLSAMSNGAALDLIDIGDDVIIGKDVILNTSCIERGQLVLRPVTIASEAHIGSHCVLDGGSRMEIAAELQSLSMLPTGAIVPAEQRWHGSPARYLAPADNPHQGRPSRPSSIRVVAFSSAAFLLSAVILPLLYLLPQIPGLLLFATFSIDGIDGWVQDALLAAPSSLAYIVCVFIELVIVRRILLGKVVPGVHNVTSIYFLRKWLVDRLMDMSLVVLHPVYATLYVIPYLRALGVKVGKGAEISNARGINFELVDIGAESFVADNVIIGDSVVHSNQLKLERTSLAPRAFAGNSALIPQGVHLESNTLVGVLSIAPDGKRVPPLKGGESCFGSPAVRMPARQGLTSTHADHLLYKPRASQIAQRLSIEGARIWLPRLAMIFGLAFGLKIFQTLYPLLGTVNTLLMLPLFELCLFSIPSILLTVSLKWILVGRYKPAEWPLWSRQVWLSEFVTSTYESLLAPLLLARLVGTPFLAMILRLLGVKIGARCTLLSHDMTEWDMVSMGDESVLNVHSGPQTHLFEDRVMKVGLVELGARAVMKPYAICLPMSSMGHSSELGSLSLLMKAESIPADQDWHGSPIVPIDKTYAGKEVRL